MVVRKLSLAEWFLHYQLKQLPKAGLSLPSSLRVDMTEAVADFRRAGQKIPANAIVLKALGLWAAKFPDVNRILFRSPWGLRFLEMDEVRINFPIEIQHNGQSLTAAIVIQNPHLKTISEIHGEIRAAKEKPLSAYPINNFLAHRRNWFFNRWLLKTLYFLTMRFPAIYVKLGGGGLSYSSLTQAQDSKMLMLPVARGHTSFTFCLNTVELTPTACYFHFGVSFDHSSHTGAQMSRRIQAFAQMMSSQNIELKPLDRPTQNDTMFNPPAMF